jgi:PAS domain S-box-containing protein
MSFQKERNPFKGIEENKAIRSILEGTSSEIGQEFFISLVQNLSNVLNTKAAWVTEYSEEEKRLKSKAFILGDQWLNDFEYSIYGTPCEVVVTEKRLVHVRDNLFAKYKGNPDLKDFSKTGAVSYLGLPLLDVDKSILGHMSVIDTYPIDKDQKVFNIFSIFANRASAEMRRLRAEKSLIDREKKLRKLFNSAMDGIIELDKNFKIASINSAAEKIFGFDKKVIGRTFNTFLAKDSSSKLLYLADSIESNPEGEKFVSIPDGITAVNVKGDKFPAEATLSAFEMDGQQYYTLILRNVNEKQISEQKIRSLMLESEYLRQELKTHTDSLGIIGNSKPLIRVMNDVKKVAKTDTTVLVYGETGTGKELIARSIHDSSKRANKPFIKVNCAAIPSTLIESELFGHEQGAFTGATRKREGRFSVADGGTIFLDEIGELPLDLQSKLLRVLQEGEFEPVGSSKTIKVDVRVLAATNRNLLIEVKEGEFREDLYYRLNVFEIELPPLRDRKGDIELLAKAFIEKFSKRDGIILDPLSKDDIDKLNSYNWPGNIRELQNVIERVFITSTNGSLNLSRSLPELFTSEDVLNANVSSIESDEIITDAELRNIEKKNIINALNKSKWKISGKNGAASLLGIPTSTLNSRIKSFNIEKE